MFCNRFKMRIQKLKSINGIQQDEIKRLRKEKENLVCAVVTMAMTTQTHNSDIITRKLEYTEGKNHIKTIVDSMSVFERIINVLRDKNVELQDENNKLRKIVVNLQDSIKLEGCDPDPDEEIKKVMERG